MPTEPYVPNIPPSGGTLEETQRYLLEEFGRVSLAVRTTTVQAAYGGLAITSPRIGELDIIPDYISAWDAFYPNRPSRITTNFNTPPVADATVLTLLEDGIYDFSCQINAEIDSGRTYNLTLRKNDNPTDVFGTWDTSNQTGQIWMTFGAMIEGQAGDVFSVWGNSTQNASTFDIQAANFQCFRVSELLKVFA